LQRAGNTLLLNVVTLLVSWGIALPLGILAAIRWRSLADRGLTVMSTVGMAVPGFVLALLMALFAAWTGWFPLGGLTSNQFPELSWPEQVWDIARHLALPVFVLSIGSIAELQRQMRGNFLEVLDAEYVRTARAKGLPEFVVLYKHALRNALNPLITLLGYELAGLLSGALLVEIVLGYPGLGYLMYQAVLQGDTNLVMASLLMSAILLVVGNLMADILLKVVDPRIELA
jgi:peptide/nickel transport system permease protein